MLADFARWLGATDVSRWLRMTPYVIQGLQTVHILALATVLGAAFLLDLRLVGAMKSGDTAAHLRRRFIPPHWIGFGALLLSGLLLIAAEPIELLFNATLRIKLVLVLCAAALTLVIGHALRVDAMLAGLATGRRALLAVCGGLSLLLFVLISFGGRFVAYVG